MEKRPVPDPFIKLEIEYIKARSQEYLWAGEVSTN